MVHNESVPLTLPEQGQFTFKIFFLQKKQLLLLLSWDAKIPISIFSAAWPASLFPKK